MHLQITTESDQWAHFFQTSHNRFISYWLKYLQKNAANHALLAADEENIRSAWLAAINEKLEEKFQQTLESLYFFYRAKGRLGDGLELFATAVSHLTPQEEEIAALSSTKQTFYGRLLAHQATFCHSLGEYKRAETLFEQAWRVLEKTNDKQFMPYLLVTKGNIVLDRYGDVTQAKKLFLQSFEQYQAFDNKIGMANVLHYLSGIHIWEKEYQPAKELTQKAITICQELGSDPFRIIARSHNNLGVALAGLGQFTEAMAAYKDCYEAAYQLQNKALMAVALANQSQIALRLNCFSDAQKLSHQQLAISREIGQLFLLSGGLTNLGNVHYMLGEFDLAWDVLLKSLEIAISTNGKPSIALTLTQFSRLLYHESNDLEAFALLTILLSYPVAQIHQGNPENLYEILLSKLAEDEVQAIQDAYQGKDLNVAINLIETMKKREFQY